MRIVSFKVAKALKEAGYPQSSHCPQYKENGEPENGFTDLGEGCISTPYYLDVWLWLRREKKIEIETYGEVNQLVKDHYELLRAVPWGIVNSNPDPEEAIIAAIEYLVGNDLIK